MKGFKMKIFIGENGGPLKGEKGIIGSIWLKDIYVPSGDLNKEGGNNHAFFISIYNMGTYVADWFDILKKFNLSPDLIKAEIILNIKSNSRVFKGKEIITVLDRLNDLHRKDKTQFYELRDFSFLS